MNLQGGLDHRIKKVASKFKWIRMSNRGSGIWSDACGRQ